MNLRLDGTWTATFSVAIVLLAALVITGAASSAYRRERSALGRAHFHAAQALEGENQAPGAIEQYRKALLFSPDEAQYRLALANALLEAGRLDESEAHLEQLAQDNPAEPLIYVDLARIAAAEHHVPEAIRAYQRAVYEYWPEDLIPKRRAARWELVNLLAAHGRRNEAVGELIQLYASAPVDPTERERIGSRLLSYGATSEAKRVFTDVLKASPQEGAAHRGLAQVAFAEADYVQARHEYARAVRLNKNDGESTAGLALTNDIIDIDPLLPAISVPERERRSQNLLRRVLKDLANCPRAETEAAQKLLARPPKRGDESGTAWQEAAQQLWSERGAACGANAPHDTAGNLVLAAMPGLGSSSASEVGP